MNYENSNERMRMIRDQSYYQRLYVENVDMQEEFKEGPSIFGPFGPPYQY
jgi:hypothetical protein